MKIMSFNTQHCLNYIEKKIDFQIIADAIRKCDADIVGLNEMRSAGEDSEYLNQTEILSQLTDMPYYYFARAIYVNGCNPYGNAILSKTPIESAETIIIPDPDERNGSEHYETRCILKAKLLNGLTVLVTHFGLNSEEQINAVKAVCENLCNEKCILMGDFNAAPDNPVLSPIYEKMNDTAALFDEAKLSFPSDKPYSKIDYIFTSSDLTVLKADIPEIIASDHRPHIAEIKY